jgi:hypothetical protein
MRVSAAPAGEPFAGDGGQSAQPTVPAGRGYPLDADLGPPTAVHAVYHSRIRVERTDNVTGCAQLMSAETGCSPHSLLAITLISWIEPCGAGLSPTDVRRRLAMR